MLAVACTQDSLIPKAEPALLDPLSWSLLEPPRSRTLGQTYSGALVWTSARTSSLRLSSALWLSNPRGCTDGVCLGGRGHMFKLGLLPPASMKYQLVPFKMGYFTLKSFQSPEAPLCHASLFKLSAPDPSCHANLLTFSYNPTLMYL